MISYESSWSPRFLYFYTGTALSSPVKVSQIDMCPTLAVMMNVPIPINNLGSVIPDTLINMNLRHKVAVSQKNSEKSFQVLKRYVDNVNKGDFLKFLTSLSNVSCGCESDTMSWCPKFYYILWYHVTWKKPAIKSFCILSNLLNEYYSIKKHIRRYPISLETGGVSTNVVNYHQRIKGI